MVNTAAVERVFEDVLSELRRTLRHAVLDAWIDPAIKDIELARIDDKINGYRARFDAAREGQKEGCK